MVHETGETPLGLTLDQSAVTLHSQEDETNFIRSRRRFKSVGVEARTSGGLPLNDPGCRSTCSTSVTSQPASDHQGRPRSLLFLSGAACEGRVYAG
jgi:hypothetical protein